MIDVFPVHHGGRRVGQVTSACFSPRLEKNIGFAMVPTELSELGTEFEVDAPSGRESAVVVPKPFLDAGKDTPKQELTASGAAQSSSKQLD
jgi:aminomethyltransferase